MDLRPDTRLCGDQLGLSELRDDQLLLEFDRWLTLPETQHLPSGELLRANYARGCALSYTASNRSRSTSV